MRRRPRAPAPPPELFEDPEARETSCRVLSLVEFAARKARPPKSTRRFTASASRIEAARREMSGIAARQAWEEARPEHLVALFCWLHEEVYGVEPAEMRPAQWEFAAKGAQEMVRRHFAGDPAACVEFMRWVWKQEHEREQWRRDNRRDGRRVGWRLQFGDYLVTDWRVWKSRRQAR